jgi:hypothetical protein
MAGKVVFGQSLPVLLLHANHLRQPRTSTSCRKQQRLLRLTRCEAATGTLRLDTGPSFEDLEFACSEVKRAPPSLVRPSLSGTTYAVSHYFFWSWNLLHVPVQLSLTLAWPCLVVASLLIEVRRHSNTKAHRSYTTQILCVSPQKQEASRGVLEAMQELQAKGALKKWGAALDPPLQRRNVFMGDLRQLGVLNPEIIGVPSVRNDAAFLMTTVGATSLLAVAGGFLPGDWVRSPQRGRLLLYALAYL